MCPLSSKVGIYALRVGEKGGKVGESEEGDNVQKKKKGHTEDLTEIVGIGSPSDNQVDVQIALKASPKLKPFSRSRNVWGSKRKNIIYSLQKVQLKRF